MVNETATGFEELIKCIIVGDSGTGKTCLTCAYACNTRYSLPKLVKTYQASVWAIDHYRHDKEVLERSWSDIDGCQVSIRLWDTFGCHDKDRRFAYRGADVVVLCFSLMQPNSLQNVTRFWHQEIQQFCPSTPIILCGTQADLRYLCFDEKYINMEKGLLYRNISTGDIVTPQEGRKVAQEIGAPYYETSVLTHHGVQDVFVNAARLALIERRKIKFWNTQLRRVQLPSIQAPIKMPPPPIPPINVTPGVSVCDISAMLDNKTECDVTFLVQGRMVEAHSICCAVASRFFCCLFRAVAEISLPHVDRASFHSTHVGQDFSDADHHDLLAGLSVESDSALSSSGQVNLGSPDCFPEAFSGFPVVVPCQLECVDSVEIHPESTSPHTRGKLRTIVTLSHDILHRPFEVVIDFMYRGSLQPCGVDLVSLRRTAQLLQLPDLVNIVDNILANQEFLNTEVEKWYNQSKLQNLRALCVNREFLSDVTFQVDNGTVAAHKALLMARCDMMLGMFSNNFIESTSDVVSFPGITVETFYALQEFIYTGEFPDLTRVDHLTLIEVANRLCLPRLVNMVEATVATKLLAPGNLEEALHNALIFLESAELYNAQQLARLCEHVLRTNFPQTLKRHQFQFQSLSQDNQKWIELNQWPPVWYVREMEFFESSTQACQQYGRQFLVHRYKRKCGCLCFGRYVDKYPITLVGDPTK